MKKLNLIIGKRQIIIVTLLVTLSIAAVLNWQFATSDQAVTVLDLSDENSKNENTQKYGATELVSNDNYITVAKLNRKANQDEINEKYNKIISSPESTDEQKESATNNIAIETNKAKQQEIIENQLAGKGFKNVISYINTNEDGKANIHVQKNDLNKDDVAQIKTIVQEVTNMSASNIVVTPVADKSVNNANIEKNEQTEQNIAR